MSTDGQNGSPDKQSPGEHLNPYSNSNFAPALLDPDLEVPEGIVGPDGNVAPKRFSVYRNNIVSSLMEAMAETYPAIKNIVGEDNFKTLARIFISKHPPSSPMMQAYGDLFPRFLQAFKPLEHSPFLVDVALVERSWIEAYHAADCQILTGEQLTSIEPETLMGTRFVKHPATSIITSQYHLYDLFCLREDGSGNGGNFEKSEAMQAVLITRPFLSVEVAKLDFANTQFFNAIVNRQTLEQCVEIAMQIDNEFDVSSAIAQSLSSGALSSGLLLEEYSQQE